MQFLKTNDPIRQSRDEYPNYVGILEGRVSRLLVARELERDNNKGSKRYCKKILDLNLDSLELREDKLINLKGKTNF